MYVPEFFNDFEIENLFLFYNKLDNLINNEELWMKHFINENFEESDKILEIKSPITQEHISSINEAKRLISIEINELLRILNRLSLD